MLFKDYHIPMIRSGSKTVTRREWSENYNHPTVGSVQIAQYNRDGLDKSPMFMTEDEADCYIRILDVFRQPLGDMDDEAARKEGDYESLAEFREGYEKVYGDGTWDSEKVVWVVEFEYVGESRPGDDTQQMTLADGSGYDTVPADSVEGNQS